MIGAIAGDIIGSVFEHQRPGYSDFDLFESASTYTDDTVMTVASAYAILNGTEYSAAYKLFGRRYPAAGYGGMFFDWLHSARTAPYNSFGNGSAMRVSPVGYARESVGEILDEAKRSAEVTHNHPEGIKGAQAVALAVFLCRKQADKAEVRREVEKRVGYDLSRSLAEIAPTYYFKVTCQESVPESITAFLESAGFEDAIRKAVMLGGDADTMACIAGAIAEAHYGGVPEQIRKSVLERLPDDLKAVVVDFQSRYLV